MNPPVINDHVVCINNDYWKMSIVFDLLLLLVIKDREHRYSHEYLLYDKRYLPLLLKVAPIAENMQCKF